MHWQRFGQFAFPYYGPTQYPPVIYENQVDGGSENRWIRAEIPAEAPDDSVFVFLTGIMIITYGETDLSETADLHIRYRRALGEENAYFPDYCAQVCESRSGGVRSPMALGVALENRGFEYHWTRSTPPPFPEHASYGFKVYAYAVWCG